MKFLISAIVSVSAWAAITASPTALSFGMRQGNALTYPYAGTRDPSALAFPTASPVLTLSGTGSWSISRTGTLATACGGGNCYTTSPTSGSGAGSTTVTFAASGAETLAAGTFTGTLTIDATAVAITLHVFPMYAYDFFPYNPGYPVGCSAATGYQTTPTCVITDERPASTSFVIPSPGGTYLDPQFGSLVRRVTPAGQNIQYGATTACSATCKYALTSDSGGSVDIYTVATGTEAYANVSGLNINFSAWDPLNDEKVWYMDGASIKSRILNTGAVATLLTMGFSLTMGGTVDITDDGWWAFRDASTLSGDICAVNLFTATTYCASLAPYSLSDLDFTQVTQVDIVSKKRYVVGIAAPDSVVFSVGTSSLTYEYTIPGGGSDFPAEPHSDVGQDEKGRQVLCWNWAEVNGDKTYYGCMQLNKGSLLTRPLEEGGGLSILWLSQAVSETDAHFGCTWRGLCVYTPYGNSNGITAKLIASITPANPCVITSTGHGYSTSNSVLIGGALGTAVSALNAVHTVTVLTGDTYTVPVSCIGATLTANSASSTLNASTAADSPFRQEIIVTRPGTEARRIAEHRAKTYTNGSTLSAYFNSPRASISRDGSVIIYASNYGIPEVPSVWAAYTGVTAQQYMKASVLPTATGAVVNYVLPVAGQGAATIVISTVPGLASPVVNASDGLSGTGRQYVASGLSANTRYYYRISTVGYSATGSFVTTAALSGVGRLLIGTTIGCIVNYGTTLSLGSYCAGPCDVSVAKGIIYTDVAGALVVR